MPEMLDRNKPYDQVIGQPGLSFTQDGKTFNGRGELVTDFSNLVPVDGPMPTPTPDDNTIPHCYEEKSENDFTKSYEGELFETMHWKKLQKLLSLYGETFTTREQAIVFLKGKK